MKVITTSNKFIYKIKYWNFLSIRRFKPTVFTGFSLNKIFLNFYIHFVWLLCSCYRSSWSTLISLTVNPSSSLSWHLFRYSGELLCGRMVLWRTRGLERIDGKGRRVGLLISESCQCGPNPLLLFDSRRPHPSWVCLRCGTWRTDLTPGRQTTTRRRREYGSRETRFTGSSPRTGDRP